MCASLSLSFARLFFLYFALPPHPSRRHISFFLSLSSSLFLSLPLSLPLSSSLLELGQIGAEASIIVRNSAWIRLGLFGGGFELNIDNQALALAKVVSRTKEQKKRAHQNSFSHTHTRTNF